VAAIEAEQGIKSQALKYRATITFAEAIVQIDCTPMTLLEVQRRDNCGQLTRSFDARNGRVRR
jgi:hypothetical protein